MHDSFGSELRVCDAGDVRVSETLMPRGLELDEHAHHSGQICFILEGTYQERLAGVDRKLGPGMMHIRGPREPHANRFSSDEDVVTLLISIDEPRWVGARLRQPAHIFQHLANDIRRELKRADDASRAAIEGLALLTMSHAARLKARDVEPAWLADALSEVERRCAEPLSLSTIARAVGVRRSELAIACRRFRATSVGEAIRTARVARAKALLATRMPLAEVALACGFHDQPHFTRVFRAMSGVTPAAYRSG